MVKKSIKMHINVEWLKSHRHLKLPVVPCNTYCEAQKPSTPEVLVENYCFLKKKATQATELQTVTVTTITTVTETVNFVLLRFP